MQRKFWIVEQQAQNYQQFWRRNIVKYRSRVQYEHSIGARYLSCSSLSLFVDCIYTFHWIITLHWRVQSLSVHKVLQSILLWPIPFGKGPQVWVRGVQVLSEVLPLREDWGPEISTMGYHTVWVICGMCYKSVDGISSGRSGLIRWRGYVHGTRRQSKLTIIQKRRRNDIIESLCELGLS